ncbi:MAG: FeoA domain-containing protein [Acutalibacteraceae bacterium]
MQVQKSLCGDPTAYLVRGAVVAIRRDDAREIMVE